MPISHFEPPAQGAVRSTSRAFFLLVAMLAAVIVSCSNQETEAPKEPPVQEETRVAPG